MVADALLAFDLALPTEITGARHLSRPDRDIIWLRKLYEKAIAGFYRVVLAPAGWQVSAGKTMRWPITSKSAGIDPILPSMRTDIVLDHWEWGRRIVIDTKFNSVLTSGWHREKNLRSAYIYQIYAYLRSQEDNGDPAGIRYAVRLAENASGLLLHPSVNDMVNEFVVIQNHEIRFTTVDLGATAQAIREQLLQVLDSDQ